MPLFENLSKDKNGITVKQSFPLQIHEKDTALKGIKSCQEVQENQQGLTPPVLSSEQVISHFGTTSWPETRLKWFQTFHFLPRMSEAILLP